ncbi:type-F conjugative transfer system secretin TraK [Providencia alcalifaciens]|uniref:type-F conjugative transfer system secretin TraK n=1 Tax=Providencia alcalifaciens TaxID=126385 RepID=UPI0015D06A0F|nr:type-F conjugative transfer system secretin TraK [Providencia alcalifaciens]MBF0693182.1 type-F conjugative transfer system secretin TraK [Providencia alcalifaciens]NYS91686.1 type-F conjugative transfer system secretin TraK [Providencia alcalifaciens]
MKKKSNPIKLLCLALAFCGFVSTVRAEPTAQLPTQISVSPDSQVKVSLSNSEPNMLVVPGDRIVAIDSAQGMLINGNQKGATGVANGGVVLMTAQTKPFTFYVRTAGGLTVSVVAVPKKRDGRVLQLISNKPAPQVAAKRWERSLPYPQMLIELHKALLNDELPNGFTSAPVIAVPDFHLPAGYTVSADAMWNGGGLRVYQLHVRNTSSVAKPLSERLFNQSGVRSVVIHPYSETVLAGATATVWLTVSNEVDNGQH